MIDDKLYELQQAARRHPDPLAIWTVYALEYYIGSGRATAAFEKQFLSYPSEKLTDMITYCMNHDRSDSGIIKSVKKLIKYKEANL